MPYPHAQKFLGSSGLRIAMVMQCALTFMWNDHRVVMRGNIVTPETLVFLALFGSLTLAVAFGFLITLEQKCQPAGWAWLALLSFAGWIVVLSLPSRDATTGFDVARPEDHAHHG